MYLLKRNASNNYKKYHIFVQKVSFTLLSVFLIILQALISQQFDNAEKYIKEAAENIFQMICLLNEVWGASLRILLGVYLLYLFLGTSCFVGIGTASVLIPALILLQHTANILKVSFSLTVQLCKIFNCLFNPFLYF